MIDVEDPKVRKVLLIVALGAAVYLAIAGYLIFMQSMEMDRVREQICNDLEKHPSDIGVRVLGENAYTFCDCKELSNGTWDCTYDKNLAILMSKNLTEIRTEVTLWTK